jgi:hypothetical protein
MNLQMLKTVAWAKALLLAATVALLLAFLFLNAGSVVEPRVHLVFIKYDRPGLLGVLLFTALAGVLGGWLVRSVFATLRQLRDVHHLSRTAGLQREIDRLEKAADNGAAEQPPVPGAHVAASPSRADAVQVTG